MFRTKFLTAGVPKTAYLQTKNTFRLFQVFPDLFLFLTCTATDQKSNDIYLPQFEYPQSRITKKN